MNSSNAVLYTLLIELDLIIFVTSVLLTGLVSLFLSKYQTIRPFFPQDATLYNTYFGDTIHTAAVFSVHYLFVAPLIYVCERNILSTQKVPRKRITAARLALGLLTSTMIAILFVEIGKGYVGRLRPSFANRCLGNQVPVEQRALLKPILSDDDCPTSNKSQLHDARRSFPSGHSALAVGGAAYAHLYTIYAASRIQGSKSVRMLLYLAGWVVMAFGFWVAASRVVDNAHHVGDVVTGSVLGLWAAVAHFWYVTSDIHEMQTKNVKVSTETVETSAAGQTDRSFTTIPNKVGCIR